jgi:transposase
MGKIINILREEIEKKEPNWRISRISQELEKYLRFRIKEKDRQINMIKSINLTRALVIMAKIRGIKARILIDFGCLGNFVFSDFVEKA